MTNWTQVVNVTRNQIAHSGSIVHARLPRSGIGNMLVVWALARVFAHRNGLPFTATGWATPRLGPWLRREQRKRIYLHYFRPSSPVAWLRARLIAKSGREVRNPAALALIAEKDRQGVTFSFAEIPDTGGNYFRDIRQYRSLLMDEIRTIPSRYCRWRLDHTQPSAIGVHVRRGDFRPLQVGEDLRSTSARTPLQFFCTVINGIREIAGRCLPVTVYSDGTDAQLADLLALPSVNRAPRNPDLVDLLSLGRSGLVVGSAHSTFSQWGGFLCRGPFVRPIVAGVAGTRDASCGVFDGGIDPDPQLWPPLLLDNIRTLANATGISE